MLLEVQKYLQSGKTLEDLNKEYGIKVVKNDELCILNYSQIDSPKYHPIVMECRGLVLELNTWNIIARSFKRFFNEGEALELEKNFDWGNYEIETKEDGSLILLFNYKNQWHVTTRGSFGLGDIGNNSGISWRQAFFNTIKPLSQPDFLNDLIQDRTYIFELCTPWNKNVRKYEYPSVFLLGIINNYTGEEFNNLKDFAYLIGCNVVKKHKTTKEELIKWLHGEAEATFEGFVFKDINGNRIKNKNPRYVALHHLRDNGNIFNPKRLIPLILANEISETVLHLPEVLPDLLKWSGILASEFKKLFVIWELFKSIESQKEFALKIKEYTEHTSLLFRCRKENKDIETVFRESEDYLIKKLVN